MVGIGEVALTCDILLLSLYVIRCYFCACFIPKQSLIKMLPQPN